MSVSPLKTYNIVLHIKAEAEGTRPSQVEVRSQSGKCATAMPPSLAINGSVLRDLETSKEWHLKKSVDFSTEVDFQPQVFVVFSF